VKNEKLRGGSDGSGAGSDVSSKGVSKATGAGASVLCASPSPAAPANLSNGTGSDGEK
jgi:hypothetical protein